LQFTLPKIYPITDTDISGLSHAEQVRRLAAGGARVVQIRQKEIDSRTWYDDLDEAVAAARSSGTALIVNDRVDIALICGADGVHLGQDDLPPAEARKLLGETAIIGYSTHTIGQVREALSMPVDYIAFGPIFRTSTKLDTDPVVGTELLRQVRDASGAMPIVAIGGINAGNVRSVLAAGADSAAMIGALISDPESITERMREMTSLCD